MKHASLHSQTGQGKRPEPSAADEPLMLLQGICKRYGETTALRNVSLSFMPGQVHGIVGENGAGKSTLVKIMSGLESPNEGEMQFGGSKISLRSPKEAYALGISTVYQELTLAPKLSVAENLLMGWQPEGQRKFYRSHLALDDLATSIMCEWALPEIPSYLTVQSLSLGDQQRLEIVRACSRRPQLLILDEPTAALGAPAVQWLTELIEKLKKVGTSIIYITHRLEEVRSSCSDVTVMRDGQHVGTVEDPRTVPTREIVKMIAGRDIDVLKMERVGPDPGAAPVLEVNSLSCGSGLRDVSLKLRPGEILGVAALEGSGQRELFLSLFGGLAAEGEIRLHSQSVTFHSPKDAVAAGVALIPEDRKAGGLLLDSSNSTNVVLASLKRFRRFGFFRAGAAREVATELLRSLAVKYSSVDDHVGALSGGNQQKVVFAKWLAAKSRIFLMYDPTRGVDPATRLDMYAKLREVTCEGCAVLLYSSEMAEVLNLASRLIVMYKGRVVKEYASPPFDHEEVVALMLGIAG